MSIHPSLSAAAQNRKQKSVLKRSERIRTMLEKGTWKEGQSVFGLPKIKTVRIKIKKEKAAEKPAEAAVTEGAATPAPETPAQATPKAQKSSSSKPEKTTK
jgi:small basic protein (TIGR04137 family)